MKIAKFLLLIVLVLCAGNPLLGQSASLTPSSPLNEYNLNGATLTVKLTGDKFLTGIGAGDFTLRNKPDGLSVSNVSRNDSVTAVLTLQFSGDFDQTIPDFYVEVESGGLEGSSNINSNQLVITAYLERSAGITSPSSMTEYNLVSGVSLTVDIEDDTLVASLSASHFDLLGGPGNLNIKAGTVSRISDSRVTMTIECLAGFETSHNDFRVRVKTSALKSGGSDLLTGTIPVTANPEPSASISGGGNVCEGSNRTLTITLSGVSRYDVQYTRDGGPPVSLIDKPNPQYINITSADAGDAGVYTLISVKDHTTGEEGVITTASATVNVIPLPAPVISGPDKPCEGTRQVYRTPKNAGSTYAWSIDINDGTISGSSSLDSVVVNWFWDRSDSWVKVTETNSGCSNSTPNFIIDFENGPSTTPNVVSDPLGKYEFCDGTSLTLKSSINMPSGYLWNTSATTREISVTASGTYSVQTRATNGCYSKPSPGYTVTKNPRPSATLGVKGPAEICEGTLGQFKIDLFSGTSPYNFSYHDGVSTVNQTNISANPFVMSFTGSTSGYVKYTLLSLSDSKGCSGQILKSRDSILVRLAPGIAINLPTDKFSTKDGAVTITATPTPGIFSSSSGAVTSVNSVGTFYPNLADTGINYIRYTTTGASCNTTDSVAVSVLVSQGEITAPGSYDNGVDKYIFCRSAMPVQIYASATNRNKILPSVFYGSGITDFPDTDSLGVFDPASAGEGRHLIRYDYYDLSGLVILTLEATFVVDDVGNVEMTGLLPQYCANADSVKIILNKTILSYGLPATESVTGPGVSGPWAGSYWFNPRKAGAPGLKTVTYNYTRTFSQCKIIRQSDMTLNPLPSLSFQVRDSCILTTSGTDSVRLYNLTPANQNVVSWEWNFGDGSPVSTLREPWHDYNSVGSKRIILKGTNNFGCASQAEKIVEFGAISRAIFDWQNECLGDTMIFTASNDGGKVISFRWDFGDGFQYPDTVTLTPRHKYGSPANYFARLRVLNNFGCMDSLVKKVPVRPTVLITSQDPYFQDFEQGDGGWVPEAVGSSWNSWELGVPAGNVIKEPGNTVWITSLNSFYADSEKSFVEGPCFDFTALERPMIKLKTWIHAESTRDGAVILSSVDDGNSWQVMGSNLDGISWYNSALLTGQPGGQRLGWTGTTQTGWKESRNLMDHLKGNKVRLRVSFGADAVASNYEGFAFDDVWIGERTRVALLEHFTNESSSQSALADNYVNIVSRTRPREVANIHYHTAFPGIDPYNTFYPAGPSARALYYGVTGVPYSVMDGLQRYYTFNGETGAYDWEENDLRKQILVDPKVSIDLSASYRSGNNLTVVSDLELLDPSLRGENLVLCVAITENKSATIRAILRRMLPDIAGTNLVDKWDPAGRTTVQINWNFNPAEFPGADSLVLTAFVQHYQTREVMQTAFRSFKDLLGSDVIRQDEPGPAFHLYPNPATNLVRIVSPSPDTKVLRVEVFNELGVRVKVSAEQSGSDSMLLGVEDLRPGLYFVKIATGTNGFHILKFIKLE